MMRKPAIPPKARYALAALLAIAAAALLLHLAGSAKPNGVATPPSRIESGATPPSGAATPPSRSPEPTPPSSSLSSGAATPSSRPPAPDPIWRTPAATAKLLRALETAGDPSDAVRTITGTGADRGNARARRAAINQLTVNLATDDISALVQFLINPHNEHSGVSITTYNVLRNDVLEVLLRQDEMPEGLGGLMVAMLRSPAEDPVWRDYSMQYMNEYYSRRWTPESDLETDPEGSDERTQMLAAYREAFDHTADTLAGTALIGFERLSRHFPEIPSEEAAAAALQMATNPAMSAASRLTALRICASTGQQGALTTARELAQIGENTALRMAAIATIGDLGTPEDLPLLNALSGSSNEAIARIATTAHERLSGKNTNGEDPS
jgi:hypothetical protein